MANGTSLKGCIDGSFTRVVPSRHDAEVEPPGANIIIDKAAFSHTRH
jgi:hypothetical protein